MDLFYAADDLRGGRHAAMGWSPLTESALREYHRRVAMNQRRDGELVETAALFRALGDRQRLCILQHLLSGEHRVVDLTAHLGLAQSTVSKHLACLRDCGLVGSRAVGRSSMFALSQPALVPVLLEAAGRLLAATDEAVTDRATFSGASA